MIFDKFRYDMAVEWDQEDPYFKDQAEKELEVSLSSLKTEGVTEAQILTYMEKRLLDEKTKSEYRLLVKAMKAQNLSEEQAAFEAQKFMEKSFAQGAKCPDGVSAVVETSF